MFLEWVLRDWQVLLSRQASYRQGSLGLIQRSLILGTGTVGDNSKSYSFLTCLLMCHAGSLLGGANATDFGRVARLNPCGPLPGGGMNYWDRHTAYRDTAGNEMASYWR